MFLGFSVGGREREREADRETETERKTEREREAFLSDVTMSTKCAESDAMSGVPEVAPHGGLQPD